MAGTAVQPEDLGTAATTDVTDYATAAQGSTAETAVQPAALASGLATKTTEIRWNGASWGTRPADTPWGVVLVSTNDENAPEPTAAFGLLKGDVHRKLVLP